MSMCPPTLFYIKYLDEVEHDAEYMLSRIIFCNKWMDNG